MKVLSIDGPAASGKGAVSLSLSTRLSFQYFSTGSVYRMLAQEVLKLPAGDRGEDKIVEAAQALASKNHSDSDLRGDSIDLRPEEVGNMASILAASENVRVALLNLQREIIAKRAEGGIIVDGRDVGTIICPEAKFKFFITASVEERANRRFKQLQSSGQKAIYCDVLQDLKDRDFRDTSRKASPLRPASDAMVIDNTNLTEHQTVEIILQRVKELGIK